MKYWWLNLYTIPFLKKLVMTYAVAVVMIWVGFMFFESKVLLFAGGYLLPVVYFFTSSSEGMVANLDFHRMSVPLRELRRAFYFDIGIQIFSFLFLGVLSLIIPYLMFSSPRINQFIWAVIASSPSFILMGSFSIFTVMVSAKTLKLKHAEMKKNEAEDKKAKKKRMIFVVFSVTIYLAFFGEMPDEKVSAIPAESFLDQFNLLFFTATLFTSCMFAANFNYSKTCFNMMRTNEKKRGFLSLISAAAASVVFCVTCGMMVKLEMNSSFYSTASKFKSLFLFSDFLPELEVETVRELTALTPTFAEEIFKNADPAFYQMPFEDFIKKKDLHTYWQYLKYGKPAQRNVVFIMKELEKNPNAKEWGSSYKYKDLKFLLVQHHPEAKSLPDFLIKEKVEIKKKRAIASKKEEVKGP